jgi:hypothetical protein
VYVHSDGVEDLKIRSIEAGSGVTIEARGMIKLLGNDPSIQLDGARMNACLFLGTERGNGPKHMQAMHACWRPREGRPGISCCLDRGRVLRARLLERPTRRARVRTMDEIGCMPGDSSPHLCVSTERICSLQGLIRARAHERENRIGCTCMYIYIGRPHQRILPGYYYLVP